MRYFAFILFFLIMGVSHVQALDPQVAKGLEENMPDLFMLEHGGPTFVIEKGLVIAQIYVHSPRTLTSKPRLTGVRVLATPEEVKEFLRGVIKNGMVELRSNPYTGSDNPKVAMFRGAIDSLGSKVLKDPTAEPMLLQILHDPEFAESYRDSAMSTLAEIDFNKHFVTFFKFIDPKELAPEFTKEDMEDTALRIMVPRASATQLDQIEAVIVNHPDEGWKRYVTDELIAERRAELNKAP